MTAPRVLALAAAVTLSVGPMRLARATEPAPPEEPPLGEVEVVAPPAAAPAASSQEIEPRDYELRPHATTPELLNQLPGVVAAQHQGGGKAPQYLVRGFDADHGTDFAVFIDDLPINLRTHAHGQGYADLSPLIPEVVERLQLFKGPYFAQFGDFATAGALNVVTKDEFKENFVLAEGGSFDTMRYAGGASHDFGGLKTLLAGQASFAEGPFDHPQDFSRYNAFTKLTMAPSDRSQAWLSGSVYDGSWHGSGQIPLREVSAGRLDRFGAIDPTEGGHSDREDLNLHYDWAPTAADAVDVQLYGSRYKLQLFSDFTFFKDTGLRFEEDGRGDIFDGGRFLGVDDRPLGRPGFVPGDGIEQNDRRWVYGGRARYTRSWSLFERPVESQVAVETRNDDVNLALHRQVRRNRFFDVNRLSVSERSTATWFDHRIVLRDWVRLEVGLRGDVFFFDGRNRLRPQPADPNFDPVPIAGSTTASIVSPKANLTFTPARETDLYLNFGEGYHSNDARNALTGARGGFDPLTKALGYELGARTRQFDRLDAAAALWLLDLDSELVFSGDAGKQETVNLVPAPASRRWGIDFESHYRILRWLVADYDLAYADARFTESAPDRSIVAGNAVPLAPTLLMNGGLTAEFANGFSIALRTRYLDDRPAIEDRSLIARGYTLVDLLGKYRWRNVEATLALLNVTDTDWREAQFADRSCVRRELGRVPGCPEPPVKQDAHGVTPRPDIHFTPGDPIGMRAGVKIYF